MTAKGDVITGLTPLEQHLRGVHPRLYFSSERVADLKRKLDREPWARFLERVRRLADEGAMPHPPAAYLLTGEQKYLDASLEAIIQIVQSPNWPQDPRAQGFAGGDVLYNLALAYDWLYHDLDAETLRLARECLEQNGRRHFEALARHELYQSNIYTCNTLADCLANVAAAGMAIFADVPDVGPWLRFVMEKARLMTDALAPDGASQEGICYGGFYTEYYMKTIDLVRELLGWDYFQGNEHLQNVPYFYLYSMLPRSRITPRSVHLSFGDCVRYNWHGPDYFLRKLAAIYRDGHAQWAADVQERTGATRHAGAFLNLVWADPSVAARSPEDLPPFRHFDDKDIVFMRSGWDGDEAVFGFKCGPSSGHHALQNYYYSIGGGHMAPDAGSFLLFAHGDWLISDGWYAQKYTSSRNTVLVNGIGQTGETGGASDWFECLELRREKRGASILRADHGAEYDYVIGNAAPAYEHEARLKRFLRHILYVRPYCWLIADELETEGPSTFEVLFHAFGEHFQTDRPFRPAQDNAWVTGGDSGALRISALLPHDVEGLSENQFIKGIGAHRDREMCLLRLRNRQKTNATVFVTVLQAYPAAGEPRFTPAIEDGGGGTCLVLGERRFALEPGQSDMATPIFRPVSER